MCNADDSLSEPAFRVNLDKQDTFDLLGRDCTAAFLRAGVCCNRIWTCLAHLGRLSQDDADNRDRFALLAFVIQSVQEAAEAVHVMRHHGAPSKLSWSEDYWDRLVDIAARWTDKNGPYRQLRNVVTHFKPEHMLRALADHDGQTLPLLRSRDGTYETTSYDGPDELVWRAWECEVPGTDNGTGQPRRRSEEEVRSVLGNVESDSLTFGVLFEAISCDLMGLGEPPPNLHEDIERILQYGNPDIPPEGFPIAD